MDKSINPKSIYTIGLACCTGGTILLALNALYYLGGWPTMPVGVGGIVILLVGVGLLLKAKKRK